MDMKGVFVLAMVAEALIEYFAAPLFNEEYKKYVKYVALVLGVALCVAYQIDILAELVGLEALHPAIGWVVSGLIIGRGSNWLNDLVDYVRSLAVIK